MKRLTILILIVVAVIAAVSLNIKRQRHADSGSMVTKFFKTQEPYDAFLSSDQVTAQRLHLKESRILTNDLPITAETEFSGGYERDKPVNMPDAQVRELKTLFQTGWTCEERSLKACIIDYGVLFTFRSRGNPVQMAVCFNCNMLDVFEGEEGNIKQINSAEDFDPVREKLVRIVKAVFPDDPEIQALKENWR